MPGYKLFQIIVGEFQIGKRGKILYKDILRRLRQQKFSQILLTRSDQGIGEKNEIRTIVFESVQFNNLPIIIETIGEEERIQQAIIEIKNTVSRGELVSMPVYRLFEDTLPVRDNDYVMLKIYIHEKSYWFGHLQHEDILHLLREHHLIWATVKRGIAGFGKEAVPKPSFLARYRVPVVIETVGEARVIKQLIPELKKKVKDGLVIAMPVEVILRG